MVLHKKFANQYRGWVCFLMTITMLLSGCGNGIQNYRDRDSDNINAEDNNGSNQQGSNANQDDDFALGLSDQSILKLKRHKVLQSDLAEALELNHSELCSELGDLDCIDEVHKLPLGGTSAYVDTIYSPIEDAIAPTVVILERIATSACGKRVEIDFQDPSNAIYFNLNSSQTNLDTALQNKLRASATKLIQNAYLREPTTDELNSFVGLYQKIQLANISDPVTAWSQASCISVFTSLEFLFY